MVSVLLRDLGVGIVDGRSEVFSGFGSWGGMDCGTGVDVVESMEGSSVGEGGRGTRLTDSSSRSVSVVIVDILNSA